MSCPSGNCLPAVAGIGFSVYVYMCMRACVFVCIVCLGGSARSCMHVRAWGCPFLRVKSRIAAVTRSPCKSHVNRECESHVCACACMRGAVLSYV